MTGIAYEGFERSIDQHVKNLRRKVRQAAGQVELIETVYGVGYRLRLFYQRTDMTVVFVYVLLLGLIGLIADYALIWLRRKLCPWFGD